MKSLSLIVAVFLSLVMMGCGSSKKSTSSSSSGSRASGDYSERVTAPSNVQNPGSQSQSQSGGTARTRSSTNPFLISKKGSSSSTSAGVPSIKKSSSSKASTSNKSSQSVNNEANKMLSKAHVDDEGVVSLDLTGNSSGTTPSSSKTTSNPVNQYAASQGKPASSYTNQYGSAQSTASQSATSTYPGASSSTSQYKSQYPGQASTYPTSSSGAASSSGGGQYVSINSGSSSSRSSSSASSYNSANYKNIPTVTEKGFYVVVGSFRSTNEAIRWGQRLYKQQFNPVIVANPAERRYRLCTNRYDTEQEAEHMARMVAQLYAEHSDAWVLPNE
ncbi:MAG: SPOR domain-containing protein [Bacteroidales bacterium]